jgi:hypothetical protein
MTTICTGWTGRNYDVLGFRFIDSFKRHWPQSVSLSVFSDCEGFRQLDECSGLAEFHARHKENPAAHGRLQTEHWKEREIVGGYSYHWDASKFAIQMFIPGAAASTLPDGELLVWFDADVVTTARVPEGFLEGLIGDANIAHLGRAPKHSEIGFWAVRLSPLTRAFLKRLADIYRSDEIFTIPETHSAFVWDYVRREFEKQGVRTRNVTPGGRGHVWPHSPLGRYTRHEKGKRKLSAMQKAA